MGSFSPNDRVADDITFLLVGQRSVVIVSCIGFGSLLLQGFSSDLFQYTTLSVLILLACIEKLCSIMNTIAIERDWVCNLHLSQACIMEVFSLPPLTCLSVFLDDSITGLDPIAES